MDSPDDVLSRAGPAPGSGRGMVAMAERERLGKNGKIVLWRGEEVVRPEELSSRQPADATKIVHYERHKYGTDRECPVIESAFLISPLS